MVGKAEEAYHADHEGMRLLILSRFEDDALQRQEVEVWLDELAPPGEHLLYDCEQLRLCHCGG